jgi:hypothetical protein
MMFRTADNPTAGAIAASMTERAENYDPRTGTDILTWRTPVAKVHDLVFGDKAKEAATAKVARTPALSDPLMATLSRIPTEGIVAQPNTMDRTIGGDTSTTNSRSMEINQNVKIDVNGASDPKATADAVAGSMDRTTASAQRSFQGGRD